jgi:hypothetical protein
VLAKDPRRMVAGLQARRAAELWRALEPVTSVESADGTSRAEAGFSLRISPPLPHGVEGTTLGYLIALTVTDPAERERFVFASDVQGPLSPVAAAYLAQERPTLVYLSGPPSYIEHEVGSATIERGIEHLLALVDRTGCRVIMDHHAVRDPRGDARFERLWRTGRVMTAAGFLGVADDPLERRRRALWSAERKPPARARTSSAIIGRRPRTMKGGRPE